MNICLIKDGEHYFAKINGFDSAIKFQDQKSYVIPPGSQLFKKIKSVGKYIAPEIKMLREYSFSADIWSLGTILNYLLYETTLNIK